MTIPFHVSKNVGNLMLLPLIWYHFDPHVLNYQKSDSNNAMGLILTECYSQIQQFALLMTNKCVIQNYVHGYLTKVFSN